MQIGFIRQESMSIKNPSTGEKETVKWFECYFRIAGVRPFSAKMVANKNKDNERQPDYYIYLRSNVNKGDSFRDIAIGSLWLGEKMIDGVVKKFMTGSIEIAFQKASIAVWKAEPRFDGEIVNYMYDIRTMQDRQERQEEYQYNDYYSNQQSQPAGGVNSVASGINQQSGGVISNGPQIIEIDVDEDEIPF